MFVCVCKGVTDSNIKQAVAEGANSLREVRNKLGAASQCGKCASLAKDIIKQELQASPCEYPQLYYAVG